MVSRNGLEFLLLAQWRFLVLTHAHDLDHLFFVQLLEAGAVDHLEVVLLCEEQAALLQVLAVECVRVLEDAAHALNADVVRQHVLALLLERWHSEAIRQLKYAYGLVQLFLLYNSKRVLVHELEQQVEHLVRDFAQNQTVLLCLLEIMREQCQKVLRS